MRLPFRRAIALSAMFCLAACTSAGATKRGVVRFNEVFAESRNEILLLNILRARFGEPQQFSTISSVSGAMRPTIGFGGEIDNIILGAANTLKPTGTVGLRNPIVTIAPLETKEFREGMMKAVEPSFVQELIEAGWAPDLVLHLVLADVKCPGGSMRTSIGPITTAPGVRVSHWSIDPGKPQNLGSTVRVPAAEAAKILREGVGNGNKVVAVEGLAGDPPDTVRLQFQKAAKTRVLLGPGAKLCGANVDSVDAGDVTLRSPSAMIQHLGDLAEGSGNGYFRVYTAFGRTPDWALVGTRFRDTVYVVSRHGNSAQTMALLAEIIGFQTTNAALNATKPTLTVSSD